MVEKLISPDISHSAFVNVSQVTHDTFRAFSPGFQVQVEGMVPPGGGRVGESKGPGAWPTCALFPREVRQSEGDLAMITERPPSGMVAD